LNSLSRAVKIKEVAPPCGHNQESPPSWHYRCELLHLADHTQGYLFNWPLIIRYRCNFIYFSECIFTLSSCWQKYS
jgi:hypothetical protein